MCPDSFGTLQVEATGSVIKESPGTGAATGSKKTRTLGLGYIGTIKRGHVTWAEHPQYPLLWPMLSGTLNNSCPAGLLLNLALPRTGD